ncbi:MAG: hypothetical protein K1060chlam4_00474 [Candidatus Anoxychlamydiales bacterium]|nr:hypothetical protein [Candidatus Anoxychlamydiales bacterium]
MKKSKYYDKIKPLLKRPFFTSKEANKKGIPSRMLIYFFEKGELEKIGRGIYKSVYYQSNINFDLEDLVLTAISIKEGVICLISALYYYDLTDQIMRQYWIAIPNKMRAPKRKHTKIIRMRNISLGHSNIKIGSLYVNIFDRERCIIDAFRYLEKEIALKALKAYLNDKKNKPNLAKLNDYAMKLKTNIQSYILAFIHE